LHKHSGPFTYISSLFSKTFYMEYRQEIFFFSGFGGLEVACWPLVPKFAGPNPAEAVGFFGRKKILSTPSFGGEVKPSVPCRALRRVKELKSDVEVATFGKISRAFLAHNSTFRCWVR
jgi:hypothetical protein